MTNMQNNTHQRKFYAFSRFVDYAINYFKHIITCNAPYYANNKSGLDVKMFETFGNIHNAESCKNTDERKQTDGCHVLYVR